MNFYACRLLTTAVFLATVTCASADEKSRQVPLDSMQRISEVVVTTDRIHKEVIPVQTLSGKELARLSAHSVADAVRYFSGVQIKDYGGIGGLKTVNIRSLGSHHVGVFYDGIELGNAQNGVVDLGRFSLDNMEAVSIYNGQKSSIFQPAKDFASASSIYMTTRTPKFESSKRNNLNLSIKGGSFETINPSLLWEHRINDRLSSSLSAEYMNTSGRYKFRYRKENGYDTTETRKNGDVRAIRVEGALLGEIKGGEWRTKLYFYDSERGYPGASTRVIPGKFPHQDRQWDNNLFFQGSLRKKLSSFFSLQLNGKYSYDYLHYLADPSDISTLPADNHYTQHETYVSVSGMFTIFDWWSASLATDFQWNTLDADLDNFVYPQRYSLLSAAATSIQVQRFKFQASLLHTYINDHTRVANANAGDKSVFTPTLVASWQPLQKIDFNLRAFYKRVFRMPTLNDLYYTFIGNINLNPEYTTQYNLGFTYAHEFSGGALRRIELQADAYYNQVEDKIIAMPTTNQFRWTMLNLGYVEIRGVDVAVQGNWRAGAVGIDTRLNYTYQRAQDFTDPEDEFTDPKENHYGGQIPYIPWHSGTAILGATYRNWQFNYSFIYTGERYESVANNAENYAQPWYTHDLSLSRTIQLRKVGLRITAEVNNILNQQYEVVQCYPMPGTNFKIKINITL